MISLLFCIVPPCLINFLLCFQICLKGKIHIFKYLNLQACHLDKKTDSLDLPSLGKRCLPQQLTDRYLQPCLSSSCLCYFSKHTYILTTMSDSTFRAPYCQHLFVSDQVFLAAQMIHIKHAKAC